MDRGVDEGAKEDPNATYVGPELGGGSVPAAFPRPPVLSLRQENLRYRIRQGHAQGGLGKVSLADDLELDRSVALKELLDAHAHDRGTQERFIAEAKITGALEHPGIVPVYGLGLYSDGRPYYAMRFIQGSSLEQAIVEHHAREASMATAETRLSLRKLLTRFIAVCNTIEYAHSRQVIHRDLKPSNIMLGSYGETLVVDWGLAKSLRDASTPAQAPAVAPGLDEHLAIQFQPLGGSSRTVMGSIVGTPQFMSPEQAAGRIDVVGTASDIYSLGATLYRLLTGKYPIVGTDLRDVLEKVKSGRIVPPQTAKPHLDKPLAAICMQAMALEIPSRYPSAAALADDLEHYLADEPVAAHVESLRERIARWTRRHRTWFQAISASLLAIISVLAISLVLIRGQRNNAIFERGRAERLADQKSRLAEEQIQLRREAQWQSARRSLEQSLLLCEREPTTGLLALVENLRESVEIEASDLEGSIRRQLRRWQGEVHAVVEAERLSGAILDILPQPKDRRMLVCYSDRPADWIEKTEQGWKLTPLPIDSPILRAAMQPNGDLMALATTEQTIVLWDRMKGAAAGPPLAIDGEVASLCFTNDGGTLLVGSGKQVQFWSIADHERLETILEHTGEVSDVVVHPKTDAIITADWSGAVHQWDLAGTRIGQPWLQSGPVMSLAINHTGTVLAIGEIGNHVILWEPAAGRPLGTPLAHQGFVLKMRFSADDRRLITGCSDQYARVWEVATGKLIGSPMRHLNIVAGLVLSPDEKVLHTGGSDGIFRSWRIADGQGARLPLKRNGNLVSAVFDADGGMIVGYCGGLSANQFVLPGEVHVWQTASDVIKGDSQLDPQWGEVGTLSPSGELLCAVSIQDPKQAIIWDLKQHTPIGSPLVHPEAIQLIAFSLDGRWIATVAEDHVIRFWNAKTGLAAGPEIKNEEVITAVVLIPSSTRRDDITSAIDSSKASDAWPGWTLLTGSWDQTAKRWDLVDGAYRVTWNQEHPGLVTAIGVDPDRKVVATGTVDGSVRFWDIDHGKQIGGVLSHPSRIKHLSYVDGSTILVGTHDGMARLWDLPLRLPIGAPIQYTKEIMTLAVDSSGRQAVIGSADWKAGRWNVGRWDVDVATIERECELATNQRRLEDRSTVALTYEEWIDRKKHRDNDQ